MIKIDNFISLFEGAVRESWERPALSDFRKSTIDYRQLAERIETLDLIWKKAGLKPGDKIAINTKSCALGASVFMAAVSKGYPEPREPLRQPHPLHGKAGFLRDGLRADAPGALRHRLRHR